MGEKAREAATAFRNSCGHAESTGPRLFNVSVSVPPALTESCVLQPTQQVGAILPVLQVRRLKWRGHRHTACKMFVL